MSKFLIQKFMDEAKAKGQKLTQKDLAEAAGVSHNAIWSIIHGKTKAPGYEILQAIAKVLSRTLNRTITIDDLIEKPSVKDLPGFDALDWKNRIPVKKEDLIPIPLIGEIPCGDLKQVSDAHIIDVYEMPSWMVSKDCFFLKAKGDSMEPIITDGDLLLIEPGIRWRDRDIVAVWIDGEVTCKFLYIYQDNATLIAANHNYPPITINGKHETHIIGRVVRSMKNFVKDWKP